MFGDSTHITSRVSRTAPLPFAVLLACMGGCGHQSATEPAALESSSLSSQLSSSPGRSLHGGPRAPSRLHFPLEVGDSWDYSFRTKYTRVIEGQSEPPRVSVLAFHEELIGVQQFGTQDYFVMKESQPPYSGRAVALFREDSNGLFVVLLPDPNTVRGGDTYSRAQDEVSAALGRLPATAAHREAYDRAAAKLAAKLVLARRCAEEPALVFNIGERKWLAYPLFVGARWKMSEAIPTECTVTARERVRVPAGTTLAWRVRMTSEGLGDDDRVETWYSAAGLVRYFTRMEQDITDSQGNVLGTLKYEGDETLTALNIRVPKRLAAAP